MNKITFTNKYRVPEWMPEHQKKFREDANTYFKNALEQVPFLKDAPIIEVTYFLRGIGSVVAKVVSGSGETYVMKTTDYVNHISNEISVYKAAHDAGIKVPKLFFDGIQDELPFFLMEYFDTGTIAEKLEKAEITLEEVSKIRNSFFFDVKKIEGNGCGWSVSYEDGILKGNFKNIHEYVDKWFGGKHFIKIAKKHMPKISWEKEMEHHADKVRKENNSICKLGIFDFQTEHIFASNPPTMFDMSLRLEPEYFDLAQLIIPLPNQNETSTFLIKSTFKEYRANSREIHFEKLFTAVWLQSYRQACNQLKHENEKRMRNGRHILQVISDKKMLQKHIERYL